jgi:hypothetical protein
MIETHDVDNLFLKMSRNMWKEWGPGKEERGNNS